MIPLNLQELFGKRYKIRLDEVAHLEPGGKVDPWFFQIPCQYGHIYPISDRSLGFFCKGSKIRAQLRREYPEIEIIQWGDFEAVFQFTQEQFEMVAKYAKPRRKRRLSENHRKKLIESNLRFRFKSKNDASGISSKQQESTILGMDDSSPHYKKVISVNPLRKYAGVEPLTGGDGERISEAFFSQSNQKSEARSLIIENNISEHPEEFREAPNERMAIMEFDGRLASEDSKRAADTQHHEIHSKKDEN